MKHPTPAERAQCVSLYSEGVLLKHLEEMFGRQRPVINRWIKQAGAKRGHKFRGRWLAVSPSDGKTP